jgi:ankyrin repeat protein
MNNRREAVRFLLANGANVWYWPQLQQHTDRSFVSTGDMKKEWDTSQLPPYHLFSEEELKKLHSDPHLFLCELTTGMHPIHFLAIHGDVESITLMLDIFDIQKQQHLQQQHSQQQQQQQHSQQHSQQQQQQSQQQHSQQQQQSQTTVVTRSSDIPTKTQKKRMIKRDLSLVQVTDDYGLTPLHWASWAGQFSVHSPLFVFAHTF